MMFRPIRQLAIGLIFYKWVLLVLTIFKVLDTDEKIKDIGRLV